MEQKQLSLPQDDIALVQETLVEISQVAEWLADLHGSNNEVSLGMSHILIHLRNIADAAFYALNVED